VVLFARYTARMAPRGRFWEGKRALVTGASSGIGATLARRLAREGARVLLTGRRGEALEAVAAAARADGAEAAVLAGDLTEGGFAARLAEFAGSGGQALDLLVCNAGVTMNARFVDLEETVLRRIMEVNFFANAALTRQLLPALAAARGRIIAVSSVTGIVGVPTRTAYAASKHALHGLFESLRIELRGTGVSVGIVCPGYVDTPMRTRALLGDGQTQGRDQAAGRRMLSAEGVAVAILEAAEKRRRLVLLGREARLARALSIVAPGLLERILARSTR
jgi:short-subunit dehydrogenase